MEPQKRSRKLKYLTGVAVAIVLLSTFLLLVFFFQGKIIGTDSGTLVIFEVGQESENHAILEEGDLIEGAPALHAALENALRSGEAAIEDDDDLHATVEYLRQRTNPDSPDWTVEYKGRIFEIQWHAP